MTLPQFRGGFSPGFGSGSGGVGFPGFFPMFGLGFPIF
jgi:hypothetical protein